MVKPHAGLLATLFTALLLWAAPSQAAEQKPPTPAKGPPPSAPPGGLPSKPDVVVRLAFLYEDVSDDMGGGYLSGEFLLLRDGRLFRRTTSSSSSPRTTTWRAGPWALDPLWKPAADLDKLVAHLTGRGFALYPPSPVPVEASEAGPFPGMPPAAGKALYPARRTGR